MLKNVGGIEDSKENSEEVAKKLNTHHENLEAMNRDESTTPRLDRRPTLDDLRARTVD